MQTPNQSKRLPKRLKFKEWRMNSFSHLRVPRVCYCSLQVCFPYFYYYIQRNEIHFQNNYHQNLIVGLNTIDGTSVVNSTTRIILPENINLVYFGIKYTELYVSLKGILYREKMNIISANSSRRDVNNTIICMM